MKKFLLIIFTAVLSCTSFAIKGFPGVDWGRDKNTIAPMFTGMKQEASQKGGITIYRANAADPDIKNYMLYFKNDRLYMIRAVFDTEKVGREEIKSIYDKLISQLGAPISNRRIEKKYEGGKLTGNYVKFIPEADTTVYYMGLDTMDEKGNMIDSNLYLDYTDTMTISAPQI